VPADLTLDRRCGESAEGHAAAGVKSVTRLDQSNRADLQEIVQILTPPHVTPSDRAHEREVGSN
jgi:hypothetical protein